VYVVVRGSARVKVEDEIVELAGWLGEQGVKNTIDPNLGGTVEFDWGWARMVQAFHTNTAPDGISTGPTSVAARTSSVKSA